MISSHDLEKASTSDFKDVAPRFCHSDVVFDIFIEIRFFALNRPLIQFFKTFLAF